MNTEDDEFLRIEAEALRQNHQSKEPTPWRDMVVVTLMREGINKHKARELADHFAAQPEQEPVAWTTMPKAADWDFVSGSKDPTNKLEGKWVPLYAAPAQRPWQGLTEEDWVESGSRKNTVLDTFACGAAWAADQLEERNNG